MHASRLVIVNDRFRTACPLLPIHGSTGAQPEQYRLGSDALTAPQVTYTALEASCAMASFVPSDGRRKFINVSGRSDADAIQILRGNVASFWRQYGQRFETWWRSLDIHARLNFVLEYSNCLPEVSTVASLGTVTC
jgi:hypothetical protein